jgi:hypothetical protein
VDTFWVGYGCHFLHTKTAVDVSVNSVPDRSTLLLFASGVIEIAGFRRTLRKQNIIFCNERGGGIYGPAFFIYFPNFFSRKRDMPNRNKGIGLLLLICICSLGLLSYFTITNQVEYLADQLEHFFDLLGNLSNQIAILPDEITVALLFSLGFLAIALFLLIKG